MSAGWDDFRGSLDKKRNDKGYKHKEVNKSSQQNDEGGCDWGFSRGPEDRSGEDGNPLLGGTSTIFIPVYERYLEDRELFNKNNTKNFATYSGRPQKALQEWFDNEGHEFQPRTTQERDNLNVCTIDLPIEDQDFTLTSKPQFKKQDAVNEVCLIACKLLDECQLLYSWQQCGASTNKEADLIRKRRSDEANKEDDIELDNTIERDSSKRLRLSPLISASTCKLAAEGIKGAAKAQVNTYETLLAKWNELNMCILQLKARLAKLDSSVVQGQQKQKPKLVEENEQSGDGALGSGEEAQEDEEELDPLDEFMSGLNTKTKLSMDEKIEKSRMKSQIVSYQREQEEVARLLELAKPKFDLNKACLSKQQQQRCSKGQK